MGEWIQLQAADGFRARAWHVAAREPARGGVVLVQEIFGVNGHIRDVARRLAEAGHAVVAPSMFDRAMPQVELGYGADGIERGVALMQQASLDAAMLDVAAARDALDPRLPRAVLGFCWGGLVAWLSACRVPGLAAAVCYYPGGIGTVALEAPQCPVLLHLAEHDDHIPVADGEQARDAHPGRVTLHTYDAQHGFHCDQRASFHAPSAAQAWERTLEFLA